MSKEEHTQKIFKSRVFEAKKILEICQYRETHSTTETINKYGVSKSSVEKWYRKFDEGWIFESPSQMTERYKKKTRMVGSNSRFSYEQKKRVMETYLKHGFSITLRKHEISETTLLRWKKLYNEGKLKPKDHKIVYKEDKISGVLRLNRKQLMSALNLNDDEITDGYFYGLTKIGKYKLINSLESTVFPIETLCILAKVSKSAYYDWIKRDKPQLPDYDIDLADWIIKLKGRNLSHLGYRAMKIKYEQETCKKDKSGKIIEGTGKIVNYKKIQRILDIIGWEAKPQYITTNNRGSKNILSSYSRHNYVKDARYADWFEEFPRLSARESNIAWATDATTIHSHASREGTLKLISIIDMHDRMILGHVWTDGKDHTRIYKKLLLDTIAKHKSVPKILHADNGFEFINNDIVKTMDDLGILPSYSAPYLPQENSIIERWHRTLKAEVDFKHAPNWASKVLVGDKWIQQYNNVRTHSSRQFNSENELVTPIGQKEYSEQTPFNTRKISFKRQRLLREKNRNDFSLEEYLKLLPKNVLKNFEKGIVPKEIIDIARRDLTNEEVNGIDTSLKNFIKMNAVTYADYKNSEDKYKKASPEIIKEYKDKGMLDETKLSEVAKSAGFEIKKQEEYQRRMEHIKSKQHKERLASAEKIKQLRKEDEEKKALKRKRKK